MSPAGARPVGALAVVCRGFDPDSLLSPHGEWALLLPELVRRGVDVTVLREGARTGDAPPWRGLRILELALPRRADLPEEAADGLWAQVAAQALADLEARAPLSVVEAPLARGEGLHAGAVTGALRVAWDTGTRGDGLAGMMADEAAAEAHVVLGTADAPTVAPLLTPAGGARVVVIGPAAALPGAAHLPAPTRAALSEALPAELVVVADPAVRVAALAALASGVPVLAGGSVGLPASPGLRVTPGPPVDEDVARALGDPALTRAARRDAPRVAAEIAAGPAAERHLRALEEARARCTPGGGSRRTLGPPGAAHGWIGPGPVDLETATIVVSEPARVDPGWRRPLAGALAELPPWAAAGPSGYVLVDGPAPVLRRLPAAVAAPCDVLVGPVSARRGDHDGRWAPGSAAAPRPPGGVWQVTGPWPVASRAAVPPAEIPLDPADAEALRREGAPWVVVPRLAGEVDAAEHAEGLAPRWAADAAAVVVELARPGRHRLAVLAESFGQPRSVAVMTDDGPVHLGEVPAGRTTWCAAELPLPAGRSRLPLRVDPPAERPSDVLGIPDERPLAVRVWWICAERVAG